MARQALEALLLLLLMVSVANADSSFLRREPANQGATADQETPAKALAPAAVPASTSTAPLAPPSQRPSGEASFFRREDAAPATPPLPAFDPNAPGAVSGPAQALDTGNLVVGLEVVSLYGIEGVEGPSVESLQNWISKEKTALTCSPHGTRRFVCRTPKGEDIGAWVLEQGFARASSDGPVAYRNRQEDARTDGRGIWQ